MALNRTRNSADLAASAEMAPGRGWAAFHFFYHGNRDLLLSHLVRPLVGRLWHRNQIDRFFFIRYNLGGPHIRLRMRPTTESAPSQLRDEVLSAAEAFYALHPSTESVSGKVIEQGNAFLAATDPSAETSAIHQDNSVSEEAFEPEVDRYGGEVLLGASLDFFQLSSLAALEHLAFHGQDPWRRRLAKIVRLQAGMAFDLADSAAEWHELLSYVETWWSNPGLAHLLEKGRAAYARQESLFQKLLLAELTKRVESPRRPWMEAGPVLRRHVEGLPAEQRLYLLQSHLHMTINRLGLDNANEVYVGGLLLAAVEGFLASTPDDLPIRAQSSETWRQLMRREQSRASEFLLGWSEPAGPMASHPPQDGNMPGSSPEIGHPCRESSE